VVLHVLHVSTVARVEFLKQRIGPAVELSGPNAEPGAQLDVERGRGLDPLPLQIQDRVAVVHEIGQSAQPLLQLFGGEVIHHVRQPYPGLDSHRPRRCDQQVRLGDAVGGLGAQNVARNVALRRHAHGERVVAPAVAHRVEQPDRLADVAGLAGDRRLREPAHRLCRPVEETRALEIGRAWLGVLLRRCVYRTH